MLRAPAAEPFPGRRAMSLVLSAGPSGWTWTDARGAGRGTSVQRVLMCGDLRPPSGSWILPTPVNRGGVCLEAAGEGSRLFLLSAPLPLGETQTGYLLKEAFWPSLSMAGGGDCLRSGHEKQLRRGRLVPVRHAHGCMTTEGATDRPCRERFALSQPARSVRLPRRPSLLLRAGDRGPRPV